MILYTVLWRKEAENELATLWCDYPERDHVTRAADRIDSELHEDGQQTGILLPDNVRALSIPALTAYFRVDEGDRKVFVEAVQLTGTN